MVLLTAEHIKKSYGTRVIFDDISFSIHEGDKIGVIGVNFENCGRRGTGRQRRNYYHEGHEAGISFADACFYAGDDRFAAGFRGG